MHCKGLTTLTQCGHGILKKRREDLICSPMSLLCNCLHIKGRGKINMYISSNQKMGSFSVHCESEYDLFSTWLHIPVCGTIKLKF